MTSLSMLAEQMEVTSMEQVRFDDAFNSVQNWTPSECAKMVEVCQERIAKETDLALEAAGVLDDPLYQPMTEEEFIVRLRAARESSTTGHVQDALEFADQLRAEL